MLLVSLLVVGVIYENGARSMESLRELAAHRGLLIGTSIDDAELGSAAFRDLVARDYGSVTPENAMKWSVTETNRGIEDFLAADRLVNLAVADGQQVRGHTLVWQRQLPGWLFTDGRPPSADELRTLLRGHITNTVARYRGRISSWDVVNEAMGDDGRLRENVFLQVLGPSYIGDAFTWAHAADPSAVLLYNDYGLENGGPKAEAVERLVRGLLDEGIPIGGRLSGPRVPVHAARPTSRHDGPVRRARFGHADHRGRRADQRQRRRQRAGRSGAGLPAPDRRLRTGAILSLLHHVGRDRRALVDPVRIPRARTRSVA